MTAQRRLWLFCLMALLVGALRESPAQVVGLAACPDQVRLTAPDAAIGAALGRSAAIDRDTIVLGAPNDDERGPFSGSAYVFVGSDSCWVQQAKLTGSDAAVAFGESVAISRDTIIVGAPFDDSDGHASGAVYVFVRSDGVWTEQAKLRPSDAAADKQFGHSVAIDGTTLVVGAWLDNEAGRNSGAAYVFARRRGWIEEAKLSASDAAEFDFFGDSVAISGRTILVGAPNAEAAYAFERRGRSWVEQVKLTASDGLGQFGASVAISHPIAVIGVPRDDGSGSSAGAAYVFGRHGGRWLERTKLTGSDAAEGDEFGHAVAIRGGIVVVGAPFEGESNEGAIYVFDRDGAAWLERVKLVPSIPMPGAFFGASVDLARDTIVVGAPSFVDFTGTCCSGAAHVLAVDPEKPPGQN